MIVMRPLQFFEKRNEPAVQPVLEEFVIGLERRLGRPIARQAPGRKPAPATTESN
jgi:hypothetical protein